MHCGPGLVDAGAPRRPCPLTLGWCGEGGSRGTHLQGLQGSPWTGAVASRHRATLLRLGKAWLSPSLLTTDILADCCTLTSTNPRGAVGFGLEDYRGESSYQMVVTAVHLLPLFSCLSKKESELWPGLWLLILKVFINYSLQLCLQASSFQHNYLLAP